MGVDTVGVGLYNMQFYKKLNDILSEAPHIAFNTPNRMIAFDFRIEKYQNDYRALVTHVRNFMATEIKGDLEKREFYKEIGLNQFLIKFLKVKYPQVYGNVSEDGIIEKFKSDIEI
jgi:hypothetical protein